MAGDNAGLLLRGIERTTWSGSGDSQTGLDHAAQEVSGTGIRVEEGRGRTAQGILQRVSTAVLYPHDGCDRGDHVAGGGRDGDAGRRREPDGGIDCAGRPRAGLEVRHP